MPLGRQVGREDEAPYNFMLGAAGVKLATQIRLYDALGDVTDAAGNRVDDKRHDPRWLFPEVMAIMEYQKNAQ